MSEFDAIPPHSLEAERAVLGSILVDHELLWDVRDIMRVADIYGHTHAAIYASMLSLLDDGEPIDKITLANEIRRRGPKALEDVGGIAYLSSLMDTVQTAGSVKYYATIVREKSRKRALISAGTRIRALGYDDGSDVIEAEVAASAALNGAIESGQSGARMLSMTELMARYDARRANAKTYLSPWPKIDARTSGFRGDQLIVWASDPKMGKSFLMVMLAVWVAMEYGPVAFFGIEMGGDSTLERFLALLSGVSASRQQMADVNPLSALQLDKLAAARKVLAKLPIVMSDEMMSSEEVVAHAHRIHRGGALKAVFVDTLGALADIQGSAAAMKQSVHERQGRATWAMKQLSKTLDAPVHVAHHLSGDDGHKRLRDGGGLQQWAHTIIHIEKPKAVEESRYDWNVTAARNGRPGKVAMHLVAANAQWLQEDQDRCWLEPAPPSATNFFADGEADLLEAYASH